MRVGMISGVHKLLSSGVDNPECHAIVMRMVVNGGK